MNMSVALYMLSMSIFPIWWSAFSEQFGRRSIYMISFTLFVIFSVLCAVSINAPMLIVFRLLAGGASASVQVVGAGTIADIWEPQERGRAMGFFYLGPLLGPLIAPILGGVLTQKLGWRATMWFLAIYGVVVLFMLCFLLPETLARRERDGTALGNQDLSRISTTESAKLKTKKFATQAKHYLIDPLKVLSLLRFPPVLLTVLIAAIAFGALFVMNIAVQQGFTKEPYNFDQLTVGLTYLAPGSGYFLASLFGGRWIDKIMAREARKAGRYDNNGKLVYLPEDRMKENAWIANTVYPLSLLWFGWSQYYGLQFMVPISALFVFGASSMLHFVSPPRLYHPLKVRNQLTQDTGAGDDDAHRVRSEEELRGRRDQQFRSQHPQLRRYYRRGALDQRCRSWIRHDHAVRVLLAVWVSWDLGHYQARACMESSHG